MPRSKSSCCVRWDRRRGIHHFCRHSIARTRAGGIHIWPSAPSECRPTLTHSILQPSLSCSVARKLTHGDGPNGLLLSSACSWLGSRKPLAGKLESVAKVCVSASLSLTGDLPPVPSRSIGWLCSSTKGHVSVSRWSLHKVTPSKFCS